VESFVLLSKESNFTPIFNTLNKEELSFNRSTKISSLVRNLVSNESIPDKRESEQKRKKIFSSPLCSACVDELVSQLNEQIECLQIENAAYDGKLEEYSKKQQHLSGRTNRELHEMEEEKRFAIEMEELTKKEEELREYLAQLNSEKKRLILEHNKQLEKIEKLELKQERYWKLYFSHLQAYEDFNEEEETAFNHKKHLKCENETLERINCFNIWYMGEFGTINGLRLGRLKEYRIDWEEINAALGLCCLLLYVLEKKQKNRFSFTMYKLIPAASASRIKSIEDGREYKLHYTLAMNLANFNKALRYFLVCVHELCMYAEHKKPDIFSKKDFVIDSESGKINGKSIEYTIEDEASWTKALKYLLITLKFLQRL
jgi:beclin 1